MPQIRTDRLTIEIAEPGEAPNNTFRFDRACFVTEVILDGAHRFCASEPRSLSHPCSGGRGFCSEIQFDPSAEAAVGEKFPKFGVGNLVKSEDAPYIFFKKYEAELYPVAWEAEPHAAVFRTDAVPCGGYALREVRKVSAEGNTMRLECEVENAGEKEIALREYCHNFLSIGGMAIGPSYVLELPGVRVPQGDIPPFHGPVNYAGDGHGIRVKAYSETAAMATFGSADIDGTLPFEWTLRNTAYGASVRCRESFTPSEVTLWCVDHIFSPEIFREVRLRPGESAAWSREYTFEA